MFTGLVEDLGTIERAERSGDGVRITIATALASDLSEGDSIAVNGVCLTATTAGPSSASGVAAVTASAGTPHPQGRNDTSFSAQVMNETLARTSLADAGPGAEVNLELPLRASDRLGGHVVQGHVDGVGTISAVSEDGFARRVEIEAPPEVLRYVVEKGSIAVDGVSLTIAECGSRSLTVSLIPETLQRTNLGKAQAGRRVNLEVDVLAKYVEKAVRSAIGASA